MLKFLGSLLQLIISPAKGWADIAASGKAPADIASAGFYPLLAITACSEFVPRLYRTIALPHMIESAVVTFISYFISYFLGAAIFIALVGKVSSDIPEEKKVQTFVIYNLSVLALITLIANCLPTELSLVAFLPLFTLIIMWAGARYLNVDEGHTARFMAICAITVLVPPYIISNLFSLIMP